MLFCPGADLNDAVPEAIHVLAIDDSIKVVDPDSALAQFSATVGYVQC
jgi:hypothetical protein